MPPLPPRTHRVAVAIAAAIGGSVGAPAPAAARSAVASADGAGAVLSHAWSGVAIRKGGVEVRDELHPRTYIQHRSVYLRSSAGRRCRATVFIDGLRIEPDDLDSFLWANEIDALEVHGRASRVPAQYQNTTDCGAILVRTERERPRGRPTAAPGR